jgi:hypothetical protein
MSEAALLAGLSKQFGEAFDVLAAAVGTFSADQWASGASPYTGPGRATAHALTCAEFYTNRDRAAFARFGKSVWEMADADVPDQPAQAEYLEQTRVMTAAWIDGFGDAGLAATDDNGATGLERIVYALRHLQHHTGEVFAYQKQMGIAVRGWD